MPPIRNVTPSPVASETTSADLMSTAGSTYGTACPAAAPGRARPPAARCGVAGGVDAGPRRPRRDHPDLDVVRRVGDQVADRLRRGVRGDAGQQPGDQRARDG